MCKIVGCVCSTCFIGGSDSPTASTQKMQRPNETTLPFSAHQPKKFPTNCCHHLQIKWMIETAYCSSSCVVVSSLRAIDSSCTWLSNTALIWHAWHTIKWWQRLMFKRLKKQMRLKFSLNTRLLPCARNLRRTNFEGNSSENIVSFAISFTPQKAVDSIPKDNLRPNGIVCICFKHINWVW